MKKEIVFVNILLIKFPIKIEQVFVKDVCRQ